MLDISTFYIKIHLHLRKDEVKLDKRRLPYGTLH